MKALKYGFGLILVGGFALTASCGGSSGDDSSASAGTSSTTGGTSSVGGFGQTTGGTVGQTTGGFGQTTGGTVGTTGGFGQTGGTVGTGGFGQTGGTTGTTGGTGAGGATMNPAGCPATAPAIPAMGMPGAACTPLATPQTTCSYVTGTMTETCTCRAPFQGGPGGGQAGAAPTDTTWRCFSMTTQIACSPTPMTGDACTRNCRPAAGGPRCQCTNGSLVCPTAMGAAGAAG